MASVQQTLVIGCWTISRTQIIGTLLAFRVIRHRGIWAALKQALAVELAGRAVRICGGKKELENLIVRKRMN